MDSNAISRPGPMCLSTFHTPLVFILGLPVAINQPQHLSTDTVARSVYKVQEQKDNQGPKLQFSAEILKDERKWMMSEN